MIKKTFQIHHKFGIHARPAATFVKVASRFKSDIKVAKDGYIANGKSIMGLMSLGAEYGSVIEITIEGEDAQEAMDALETLINNNFEEDH
ncbi:MAG: HPr family phosphocarrier protein [Calditrichaeota bacterium]|nr:MAG: HPr family phosphocarrier protein [Calditrichota bacterium]